MLSVAQAKAIRAGSNGLPTYRLLEATLEANGGKTKVLPHTTVFKDRDGILYVDYYSTTIVTAYPDGYVKLNTGGHFTKTTAQRINLFYSGKVIQSQYQCYAYPLNAAVAIAFNVSILIISEEKELWTQPKEVCS